MNYGTEFWPEGGMKMAEIINRSIAQVIYKHTPNSFIAIDEGIFGIVDQINGQRDHDVDMNLLFKKINWFVEKWKEESNGKIRGFDYQDRDSFLPIRPTEGVVWKLFTTLFECLNKNCRVVNDPNTGNFDGKCSRCSSGLKQFRYVWFHPCGSIYPLFILKGKDCKIHGRKSLYLEDTGRFNTSYWRCRECSYTASIGMLPCPDQFCKSKRKSSVVEFHQGSVWNDPWVYFTQLVNFVNLKEDQINPLLESKNKHELLLSAFLGNVQAGQGTLKRKAKEEQMTITCQNCGAEIPQNSLYCNQCAAKQTIVVNNNSKEVIDNQPEELFTEDSDLTTFSAVRDLEESISLKDEKNRLERTQDTGSANSLKNSLSEFNKIGVFDATLIGDFPLTSAAIGYSRFQSKPPMWLRAFQPANDTDTRIPVYTNCTTTEAWMIQLSAKYILSWLTINNLISDEDKKEIKTFDESESKLWLIKALYTDSVDGSKNGLYKIVHELIHTFSHTLLHSLAVESGSDIASCGEMLLPNALSFIVYVGETDIGGLTATFKQGLSTVIDNIDQFHVCKFDPSCSADDDSACVGCIYLPRGCVEFNEKLSRTYLFGGKNKSLSAKDIKVGYFDVII